jgi:hypothetical protein
VSETSRALDSYDGGCKRKRLLDAEAAVLQGLWYELGAPPVCASMNMHRLRVHGAGDEAGAQLASYVAKIILPDYGVLQFRSPHRPYLSRV